MKYIDYVLNRITMYRLLMYYLLALLGIAFLLGLFHQMPFNSFALAFSTGYIVIICWLTNQIFAKIFEAPVNIESVYITALILALIVTPLKIPHDIVFLTAVSGLAISSKFILAIRKKHIFNPAAVAVFLTAMGPGQAASWWVGRANLLPFVILGGLLIVRKIRRGDMMIGFFTSVAFSTAIVSLLTHHNAISSLQKLVLHSALFFFAFVMLTEPMTSPVTKTNQTMYGVLAGLIFPPQIHIFSLYSTPELTLLVSNVFSYIVSPKLKFTPKLVGKMQAAPDTIDFVFEPERKVTFLPGQYAEMTLPHGNADRRGNRRYFTIASSPTESDLRFGVKFYDKSSSFKKTMSSMNSKSPVAFGQVGGDFVLPKNASKKLAFIAGGIGVTPYRSMIKYLIDHNDSRSITLLYSEKNEAELAYTNIFEEATKKIGTKVVYTLTDEPQSDDWSGRTGYITADVIKAEIPDYAERLFYISGSHSMVTSMTKALKSLGVKKSNIKTDFFPGFA